MNGRAIVFDFSGVLFHWQPAALLQRVIPEHAHDAASTAHWQAQIFQAYGGDWGEFDRGTLSATHLVPQIARRTGLSAAAVQAVVDAVPLSLQPRVDTVAWLHALHAQGWRLHYLSNMPEPYAQHLLREHDFLRLFRSGVFSCQVRLNKPEAAIYQVAEHTFGVTGSQLMFLDDHLPNVHAAQAAGWQALHFEHAHLAQAQMQALGW